MSKNEKNGVEFVEFDFQTISLREAMQLSAAGKGRYAGVATKLIEQIPTLINQENPQTIAFGLPNGHELPEKERRGISTSVSIALKKADIPFRVTYSSSRKVFLVVPREGQSLPKMKAKGSPNSNGAITNPKTMKSLVSLAAKAFGVGEKLEGATKDQRKAFAKVVVEYIDRKAIAKTLNISVPGVTYLIGARGGDGEQQILRAALKDKEAES